jgi:hypothetical protein
MKILYDTVPTMTIEEFADKYGLTMVVKERRNTNFFSERYYAYFHGVETITGDGFLRSDFGNGATPEMAIASYAKIIDTKRIVIDAYKDTRKEIDVPRII